ncbi:MAG: tyrosine-type recombinase/integrase [Halobacteriovoraceae bacterium]|jgi:integrase|nr:tyrosine-type recombinase/integrase [Halobacteriovoraceae bacterium]
MKRYARTQVKNVRKDQHSNKYEAYKTINGKRYSEYFKNISEAKSWVKQFHPDLQSTQTSISNSLIVKYKLYRERVNSRLALSTQDRKDQSINYFLTQIGHISIDTITPRLISEVLETLKRKATHKRFNFKGPLKELKATFNWLIDHDETTLLKNPVRKHHISDSFVKEIPIKKKFLDEKELQEFFRQLEPEMFRSFAYVQYITGCRVQEIAGLQKTDIDLSNNCLTIQNVVMWDSNKNYLGLKPYTKNKKCKKVLIGDSVLKAIITKYLSSGNSPFLFNIDGQCLKYRKIQYEYCKALRKGNITVNSSTHFLRTTMARITNINTGSIDAVQVVLGHDDAKMSRHYAGVNQELQLKAQLAATKTLQNVHRCADIKREYRNE